MEIVTTIAPIALGIIMLSLGLGLTIDDFKRLIIQPKDFFVGLSCQIILLPIIAFFLILIFKIPPELALGFMILAAAPGGVTSNVLTKFANGDVALSISLTGVTSLISIFTVPFIIIYSANIFEINNINQNFSVLNISLKMFFVVTFPVVIGMIIRHLLNNFIIRSKKIIDNLSILFFLIVFLSIWIEEWDNIIIYITGAGLYALILNLTMMVLAYFIAKKFTTGIKQQKCISLECGLQNGTLAVFVATQFFNEIEYLIPTAAYALIMFVTSIIFTLFIRRVN